ncbi:MAG: sigma-70 family RNA polymerase sigma factor [Actinobacteria bacterium]|jgi:RNA polymerase sigma-70 factor, ECF subfamily|nr:sigma-70 family RNA polymerase sigma factor [Actinomycetota bacterium]MBU2111262.1 sigma-70 family RNA polymerase sigma factor [Actinomycetota bacterium]
MTLDPERRGTDAPPDPRLRAFADVVEPEIEVLLRVGRSLTGSDTDAEDLVQETMIRAFGAIDRFDGRHPRAWLLTILRRTHLNMHRRQRPSTVGDWEVLHHARPAFGRAHGPSAEDRALAEDLDPALHAAMAALDERFRAAVVLVDVHDLSYADAAAVLDVPVGTIMSRLSRARTRLRAALAADSSRTGRETR